MCMRTRKLRNVAQVAFPVLASLVIALVAVCWVESTPTVKISSSTGEVVGCYKRSLGGKVVSLDWSVVQKTGRSYDPIWVK